MQYAADDLVVTGEDLTLTLEEGSVFVAETEEGVTGLVLLGDGVMRFSPQPEAERRQVEIFSGREALEADFEAAFVRLHPGAYRARVSTGALRARGVDRGALRDAEAVLDEFVPLSFTPGPVGPQRPRLVPSAGARRLPRGGPHPSDRGTLTYAQSVRQPEDISLFERETNRIISLYSSARKRATRGRYFGDDDSLSLDILDYEVTASFEPLGFTQQRLRARREFVECRIVGTTRIAARVKGLPITSFSLRLADELAVRSVTSNEFGPLLFFRMNGQNNLVVNLPEEVAGGTEFTVTVTYEGDLAAQELDENWIGRQTVRLEDRERLFGIGEPRYIYSNRSYWYPQALVTDYATATLDLSVPPGWGVVASGVPAGTNPPLADDAAGGGRREFSFTALQPARYLSAVISRFDEHISPVRQIRLDDPSPRPASAQAEGGVFYGTLAVGAYGTPRSADDLDETAERAADIAAFYASVLGDIPYPSMTLALTDSRLPGGHSPAYFALMNHELPRQPGAVVTWQTDPAVFTGFPPFFLAHEIAHQWWGQAVGWKNYHEQWLSEGLAQYFAALYAEHDEGPDVFQDIIERMRSWAMRHSDEGPVYLGYRLGHLEREPRIFRALVYNKGAMVLHMLRRLVGDDAFFAGLRRFYHEWRFRKAGTDALQLAFEIEAGRSLSRFFDRWIHESDLPEVRFSSRTEANENGREVVLRFEQLSDRLFDLPVTVTVQYRSGEEQSAVVPVSERVTEHRLPARGRVRRVSVNRDRMALANIDR